MLCLCAVTQSTGHISMHAHPFPPSLALTARLSEMGRRGGDYYTAVIEGARDGLPLLLEGRATRNTYSPIHGLQQSVPPSTNPQPRVHSHTRDTRTHTHVSFSQTLRR